MNIHKTSFILMFLALLLAGPTVRAADQPQEEKITCPVCSREMKKTADTISLEYKGQTFYFASTACREAFAKEPEKYVKTVYTCPMHPEVQAAEKGKCPKCGMSLEAWLVARNNGGHSGEKADTAADTGHIH